MKDSRMEIETLKTWNLFNQNPEVLDDVLALHIFRDGKGAYLIKNGIILTYWYSPKSRCAALEPNIIELKNEGIKALSTGEEHAVLLDNNGKVFCWGCNRSYQLGICVDDIGWRQIISPNLPVITQIGCGRQYTIALSNENQVYLWGTMCNSVQYYSPKGLLSPEYVDKVLAIAAGSSHALMLTETGKVFTWGANMFEAIGGHRKGLPTPQLVEFDKAVVGLGAGLFCSAFLTVDGKLYYCGQEFKYIVTEIESGGDLIYISARWNAECFGLSSRRGDIHFYKACIPQTSYNTIKNKFSNINEIFRRFGTPTRFPVVEVGGGIVELIKTRIIDFSSFNSEYKGIKDCGFKSHIDATDMLGNPLFSDIKLKLKDGILHAHKLILIKKSTYFEKLFTNILEDSSRSHEIDLSFYDPALCRTFIKYVYTGVFDQVPLYKIPEIFFFAGDDQNLTVLCTHIWKESLTRENVLRLYNRAHKFKVQTLMDACCILLFKHKNNILPSMRFKTLSDDVRMSIIKRIESVHNNPEVYLNNPNYSTIKK